MSAATDYVQLTHAASEIDGTIEEVYAARGSYGNLSLKIASKQDELSQSQLAAANSGITAAKLTADEAALAEAVDGGAKNLFDYDVLGPNSSNIGTSIVVNGVRFTMNSDKSVTITRESTSSQNAYVWFRNSDGSAVYVTDFCDDEHVFSGAAGASASTYTLYINNINGSNTNKYFGEGEIIGTPQVTPNAAGIFIAAGYSPSNLVIKPMICTKAAWDVSHTYEPYALPNPVITPSLIEQVDSGAKNIVHTQDITRQGKGYIATPNGDGTYTVTGSRTDTGSAWLEVADVSAEAGSYMLSGGVTGIPVAISVGGSVVYAESSAQEINAKISNKLYIHIPSGFNQSNINYVVKPMICTLADWNVSQKYVPYALTNSELTEKLTADEADITSVKHMVDPRSQSQVSGGNLDNITVSEIRVYIAPSGLPTGVSASSICIAQTCVVDSNSAYQVITLLSNQGTAQNRSYPTYKRVKVGGVWYDWKLIVS